jgi:hypothetical protein
MQRRGRIREMDLVWPLFAGLGFILKVTNRSLFAWWLGPWLQRRANRVLLDDVQANLYFLYSEGQPIEEKWPRALPFDYASVYIVFEHLLFCFTRGRGELNVSVAPRHAPDESFQLAVILAALDSIDITQVTQLSNLSEVADLLRARLPDFNIAFSELQYPEFKKRLLKVKESERTLIRQAEWELNKQLQKS